MTANFFAALSVRDWRQFSSIEIELHPRLTIITGANGAGKSTLLRLLAQHFGWNFPLLATPRLSPSGGLSYSYGLWDWLWPERVPASQLIGTLSYSDGGVANLRVPPSSGVQFNVIIEGARSISGLNISSHRPAASYQQITSIPTSAIGASEAFATYNSEVISRFQNSYTQYSPVYRMKEAIISMATFGPGNQYVQRNETVAGLFEGFKDVLKKVLPESIGFRDISVRVPDVVLVTDSGEFVIDASSGGIMSLIDLAWQIFLFAHDKNEFVVILDEPENHLHPNMQRNILASMLAAFPKAQFIVATHSPFVVSSVRDSYVYVLRYDHIVEPTPVGQLRSVSSIRLDHANKAGTASEILRDVLGVPITLPEWAELEIKDIASEFHVDELDQDVIGQLRSRLNAAGLGEYYPDAIKQIASQQ